MLQRIANIIQDYRERVRELPYVPRTSYVRDSLGYRGDANKLFLTFLFCVRNIGIQFLKDVELIRIKMLCNACGRDMTCCPDSSKADGFRWRCRRMVAGTRCSASRSIRYGSLFQRSHLTLQEVFYLTFDILRREPAHLIEREHHFCHHTIAEWGIFCRDICRAAARNSAVLTSPLR